MEVPNFGEKNWIDVFLTLQKLESTFFSKM
jgi:hypothetical protein